MFIYKTGNYKLLLKVTKRNNLYNENIRLFIPSLFFKLDNKQSEDIFCYYSRDKLQLTLVPTQVEGFPSN